MAGGSGRTCDFFLQGRCKFGENCKNEHPRGNQNRFAALSNPPSSGGRARSGGFGGGDRSPTPRGSAASERRQTDTYRQTDRPGQDNKLPYHLNRDAIKADLSQGADGERPSWKLSAYGPGRDAPRQLLEGAIEVSPEELRVQCYLAQAAGQQNVYAQNEANAFAQADDQARKVLSDIDGAIKYVIDGENQHPNRNDQVIKNSGGLKASSGFGSGSSQRPGPEGFGQASAQGSGSSGFGQASQLGGGSGFGRPSGLGGGTSAFGQSSTSGPKPAFGAPSQPRGGSAFGASSALGSGGNAFGAPSSFGQKPAFGPPAQPTQPSFGQSGFGQASTPASSAPTQPASGFGQTSAVGGGPKPNPFASASNQASGFGQVGQNQSQRPNPFAGGGQTSGFGSAGAQAGSNPFARSGQTSGFGSAGAQAGSNPFATKSSGTPSFGAPSPFGQPAQPTTTDFGGPSQNTPAASGPQLNANPFAPRAPAAPAPSHGGFGGQATHAAPAPPPGPGAQASGAGAAGLAATASYTTRTANGTLSGWKGFPVSYDEDRVPTYTDPRTGKPERIWLPDGLPSKPNLYAEAPPDIYLGEIGTVLKQVYDYVRDKEEFPDGIMPEIPPKREWIRWDV